MSPDSPNVLLIHCHDLGQYAGCYGIDIETPNLDRLAENGARFENHFASAPQCSPSRGSLLTGKYPHVHGLVGLAHHDWSLDANADPLPRRLAEEGYDTHLFGLQHVAEDPASVGYAHVHREGVLSPGVTPVDHERNPALEVAPAVETFLEAGEYEEPFFASVGFFETHLVPGDRGMFGFGDGYDADDPADVEVPPYLPDVPPIREDVAAMRGMVYALDEAVGNLLDALEATGLADDTLVIFTTEHGIPFPRAKGTCYDSGIEAALLVQYPPLVEAGAVYEELIGNVDVFPTVLELVTGEAPAGIDGRSFLPLLSGDDYAARDRLFAEITWHDAYNPIRAVRTERYKYVRNFWRLPRVYLPNDVARSKSGRVVRGEYSLPTRPYEELYDLDEDPHERTNVADDEAYEDVRADLEAQLRDWMHRTDDPLLDGPVLPPDYETIFDGMR